MGCFQVMTHILTHQDQFFTTQYGRLYLASPTNAQQITWFFDHVEVWYNLFRFFVPRGHQGLYKFSSGFTLGALSPSETEKELERLKEKQEKESELRRTLGEAKKRLEMVKGKVMEVEKEILEPEHIEQEIQDEITRVQEKGKAKESARVAQIEQRDTLVSDRDVIMQEVDDLVGRLEQIRVPQPENPQPSPSHLSPPSIPPSIPPSSAPTPSPTPGPSRQRAPESVAPVVPSDGEWETDRD